MAHINHKKGNTSISSYGSGGSENGEFSYAYEIGISHPGELFVADKGNHRVQVLDQNGSFLRKFGSYGTAPGQLRGPRGLCILQNGNVVVGDEYYLHYFQPDGTFIKRVNASSARYYVSGAKDGTLFSSRHLRDADGNSLQNASFIGHVESRTCFTPEGDLIESHNNKIRIWKRAYRTKGLPVRNVIPQPAVRAITQRAGTNIIDLDFEIIDPDDANATVGILAAQDGAFDDTSKWILPQTWVDGTGSKIGTPIATNQIHRVSWNVKPDWPDSTGTLKFEIICHDARRTAPVDLHFLTLPLSDGNLTISRSPLKDSDFESYAKFLLTTGQAQFESNVSKAVIIPKVETNASQVYIFTNAGATGKDGPTPAQLIAEYNGTNLQGSLSAGSKPGFQEWTVPQAGEYFIEAIGARSGKSASRTDFGRGSFVRGKFLLNANQKLTIVVGQAGQDCTYDRASSGGGATYVALDSNQTVLAIAGGGGGSYRYSRGGDGVLTPYGQDIYGIMGGRNGAGGGGTNSSGGGGGFSSDGQGGNFKGKSFTSGANGGNGSLVGGFGGGGGTQYNGGDFAGGGGGFSGGAGAESNGGGGGSFVGGTNKTLVSSVGIGHGYVRIFRAEGINPGMPKVCLLYSDRNPTENLRGKTIITNHQNLRYASPEEVIKAREAATTGSVNKWTTNRPIVPRSLPRKINEYGFDTGFDREGYNTRYGYKDWWVVQE